MEKIYDLVVIGGGLAGVCGAISARRNGLSVIIIQDRPVFGGNASSEIRVNIGGACGGLSPNAWARETGIICELFLEERKRNFAPYRNSFINSNFDIVLYEFLRNEGVDILLDTSARKAIMKKHDLIEGVLCIQLGSEKEFVVKGKYFLDASGDGTIAYSAGAEFRIGRESRYEFNESLAPEKEDMGIMGNSLLFLVRDAGRPVKFTPPSWIVKYKKDDITLKLRRHDYLPGYWWIEVGFPYDTIYENEDIKHNLISHVLGVWDHLKNEGEHGFENYVIEWIGMVPGKRESRRFAGDYILNENDVKERKIFPDAIAYGGWFIDLHTPGGILAKEDFPEPSQSGKIEEIEKRIVYIYTIPFRCIYSKNIKNLVMAGRNISVTHVALGTTRVMGTCALIGQAAGTAISICKKYGIFPSDIYPSRIKELQQKLLKDGCFIPGIKNEDKSDILRDSKVNASSHRMLKMEKSDSEAHLCIAIGQKLPLKGKIEDIAVKVRAKRDTFLKFHLRESYDLWDFSSRKDIICRKIKVRKGENIVKIRINREFNEGIYWFFFDENENVYLMESLSQFPGLSKIFRCREKWRFDKRKNIWFEIRPPLFPFQPENIISGVSRPERWTNVWISEDGFPQWVEFVFKEKRKIGMVQFMFDAAINLEYNEIPPFFVPDQIPSHYTISLKSGNRWIKVVEVKDNTSYFCRHKFKPETAERLKIEIFKTNGSRYVSIYEARAYGS